MRREADSFHSTESAYTEEIFIVGDAQGLNASEQDAVSEALSNNDAVGVVIGAYDEKLTITMASNFFLKSLGMTSADLDASADHSLLSLIQEDDRRFFVPENFHTLSGRFEFRMTDKQGNRAYVYAYKTESVSASGDPQWVLSTRVSHETVGVNQFIQALSYLIERYVICDLKRSSYEFFCYNNGESYLTRGTYDNLAEGMVDQLGITSGIEELERALSPEVVAEHLKTMEHLYRYDYAAEDESVFYRMAIVPQEFEGGSPVKFMIFVMDVTQAHRDDIQMRQALQNAYHAADKASSAKTSFLSSMSHDIRTPMNAIIGMTAIASAHIDERDRVLDALTKITISSRHLLGLINEVLDMSRIESGKITLNEEDFSLPDLIEGMVEMVKPSLIARSQDFDISVSKIEHEDVVGDPLRIQQVFTNIVGNAVKYTPEGGSVRVSIAELPTNKKHIACYELVVEDSGVGMDAAFIEQIFEPFSRAENAENTAVQGTGLGMPIAKSIVSMMDGDIKVESSLGKGSKFTATIFLQTQQIDDGADDALADLPVLVVDDDVISCESTVETLISIGMQGEWVDNGPDAIERVAERHTAADDFYAVILDWKMPGMDGVETARGIRAAVGPDIPIIMLTAYDFGDIEEEARAAGVNCFVAKPLFKSRLKSVFRRLASEDEGASEERSANGGLALGDYTGKRALVVEDNMLNREIMVEVLDETNIDIETAVNGQIAVDMVADAPEGYYDIIFMDIQMPVMNGYDATTAIRALPDGKGATLPIVVLTANAFAEDVIMAKNAGANEHVAKPVDIDRLADVMREYIK